MKRFAASPVLALLTLIISISPGFASDDDIRTQTREFLDAYTHGNLKKCYLWWIQA
jgi:hypothetical protein